MTYKISIGKQTFFGNCFTEKLVYTPIPKKVINDLHKDSINVFLTHVQVYDYYDVIANFQYGSFPRPSPSDAIISNNLIDNDSIVNYSYSKQDLVDILNRVDKDYIEFYKVKIILLLLAEKVNNQQLCLYHYINNEINRTVLSILLNNTLLLFTKIILHSPEENSLNNFTENVQDEENKSKEIIIHNRNDFTEKEEKIEKADINLHISEKELIDKFFIMKNIIEAKKLIKKL